MISFIRLPTKNLVKPKSKAVLSWSNPLKRSERRRRKRVRKKNLRKREGKNHPPARLDQILDLPPHLPAKHRLNSIRYLFWFPYCNIPYSFRLVEVVLGVVFVVVIVCISFVL